MNNCDWLEEIEDLESAEDFLDYFGIAYDRPVVQVNRLHILQRFSDMGWQRPELAATLNLPIARAMLER